MNSWNRSAAWMAAVAMLSVGGCGSGSSSESNATVPGNESGGNDPNGSSSGSATGSALPGSGSADAGLPAEIKAEDNYKAPVATGSVVWIANPISGRVAYIDVASLHVQTVAAGNAPTYLAAVPDPGHSPPDDVAIVLNVLSQDATLLRDHNGVLTTFTFPTTANANAWAVSATGRWAIAWTDASRLTDADPTQGFQSLAVIDLTGARPTTLLAVGYRPSQIVFSADDTRAFAVTDDGISVVDLLGGSQPTVTRQDPLTSSTSTPLPDAGAAPDAGSTPDASPDAGVPADASGAEGSAGSPDVSFTPDGAYALVRTDGTSSIAIDSLRDGTLTTVPLPSPPTDLTIAPTGKFAVAVLRDTSTVVLLPLPGVATNPASITSIPIPGEIVGRAIVTADGATVLLFTTVADVSRLTVLTPAPTPTYRTVTLHAPVMAVFPTNDGQNAIVLHRMTTASLGSTTKGAFSVVPIAKPLPAFIQSVPATPTAVALSASGDRALISTRDDTSSTFGLYVALMPSLQVTPFTLASAPIAVGIAGGAQRGYAAQDYPEGRITFVDLAQDGGATVGGSFTARTITGFELGARVAVGSQP